MMKQIYQEDMFWLAGALEFGLRKEIIFNVNDLHSYIMRLKQ